MLKFLLVVAILFAVALGFHWLKDADGEVVLTLAGTGYAVDLTIAVIALLAIILVTMGLIWFLQELFRAPARMALGRRRRSAERGRAAISQGLIAIAAGDLRGAERAMLESSRRAPDQPLARLLEAQTAQLRGDRAAAREVFQKMTESRETRIAGLRGLYVEAEREGEDAAARLIAEQAREESPASPWAARALLRHQTAAADWNGALQTLSGAADGRVLDRRTARRQRAVILTAEALDREAGDPDAARNAAIEAHELAPDLAPAAVVAGRVLSRQGDVRRATRILETSWKAAPHPELADAYLHVRAGDSAGDRLKRAETLLRLRPQADEGRLALARAAIDARDFARAREALTPVLTERPTRNALFLMAALEESETGDRGRSREWIARAARAPRDPVWTADGVVLEAWAPASPVTGRLDAVEWRVPVAELEAPRLEIDAAELEPAPAPVAESRMEAKPERMSHLSEQDLPAPEARAEAALEPAPVVATATPPLSEEPAEVPLPTWLRKDETPAAVVDQPAGARTNGSGSPSEAWFKEPRETPDLGARPGGEEERETGTAEAPAGPEAAEEPVLPPLPDDPGVSEEDEPARRSRRFRII